MSMEDGNSTCDISFLKKSLQNCKKLFFFLGTQCTIPTGEVFKLLQGFEMDLNTVTFHKQKPKHQSQLIDQIPSPITSSPI